MTSPDPLLALITACRDGLTVFNAACSPAITGPKDEALAAATYKPHLDRLCSPLPAATTLIGAIEAFRFVLHEEETVGHTEALTINVLKAGLAFFDNPKPAMHDPLAEVLKDYQAQLDKFEEAPLPSDEEFNALMDSTWGGFEKAVGAGETILPDATTAAGAALALRLALKDEDLADFQNILIEKALAFLEGRSV